MPLLKRPGSDKWYVEINVNGKRVRRSTGTTDKRLAEQYERKLQYELWQTRHLQEPAPRRFEDAALLWMNSEERDASDLYRLASFLKLLGNPLLTEITKERVSELCTAAWSQLAPATINRNLNLLTAVLNLAKANGWLHHVPTFPRREGNSKRLRWLTVEELNRLLAELKPTAPHLYIMARFAVSTGLRRANVTGLRKDHIDLGRRVAWVVADESKSGEAIGVPLNNDAIAAIEDGLATSGDSPYVFNYRGKPIEQTCTKAFKKALKRAGIDNFKWHDLRHTWASHHVMNGTRLEELQKLGGWADMSMVLRYAHLSPEYLHSVASNIQLIGKNDE